MERYNCTCHCGGSMFYKHLHDPSCDLFMHGEEAPQSKEAQLQAALDAEREKVKELECYRALWKRRDDELTGVLAQLATLQAQLVAEQQRADRAVKDRSDVLYVKTKEGLSCSEWLMRTAIAERKVKDLEAQLRQVEGELAAMKGATNASS